MKKTLSVIGFLACATFLPWMGGGGCGAVAETPVELSGGEDLLEPTSLSAEDHGGYTDENETPAFGLDVMATLTSDAETPDAAVTPEEEATLESDPEAQVYMVRIVWGDLARNAKGELPPAEDTEVVSWDGSLSYDGAGYVLSERSILFEGGDDIPGDKDPFSISWSSVTGPHVDGLLAKLIVTPGKASDTLHFETKPLTHDIALADLDAYNEILSVDEDGHAVAFTVIRIDANGKNGVCAEGFWEGKYHARLDGHDGSVLRGRILSANGDVNGHVRGHSGVDEEDASLFFGKAIDVDGFFAGFLEGTLTDGAIAAGNFSARTVNGADLDSGFFQGYWTEFCE